MYPFIHILGLSFPAYGVMCAAGILAAMVGGLFRARHMRLRADVLLILFTCALVAGGAGAFVMYAFVTYGARGLIDMAKRGAFLREFSPGFVFYGGLIPGLTGAYLAARACKARLATYSRALTPMLPLAHAFGRVGCLLAGCCYGRETTCTFAVTYPESNLISIAPKGVPLIPVQLIECAFLLLLCLALIAYARKPRRVDVLCVYALIYAPARFLLEFLRGDAIRGAALGLSTSQWFGMALFILAGAWALYRARERA